MAPPTPAIIAAAADWAAELDAGDLSTARRKVCEAWCGEDPRHRMTLERMRGLDGGIIRLDVAGRLALRAVLTRRPRHRRTGFAAFCLALLVFAAGLGTQSLAIRERLAEHQSAVGEVRQVALADGSRLDIDTGSAVDFDTRRGRRQVSLYRGQVLVHVASDPTAPFVVMTRHGTATALGTAYAVRDEGESTLVSVVESTVKVCAKGTTDGCVTLNAGERARVSGGDVARVAGIDTDQAAGWASGWLEADDQPIAEVLAELNRYRARPVGYAPSAVAGVHVTGAYPLNDTDRAVEALAQAAGLRLVRQPDGAISLAR